ncbi:DUF3515 domain-containing protein [Streptomyces purpureus]|uniref:DUF3515 domain-containing protein n=1 Tax=Streptomyces purpureus TaxID=1951 RepID=UPI00037936A7|nr:DUF3515 domain-containing protein [Streptomyces purpureus]
MTSHRLVRLPVAAAAVLLAVSGCSSGGSAASVAVPSPPAGEAAFCRALHEELPRTVAGLDRKDPEPESELTAGWGDAAIVLRCGVPRPEKLNDVRAPGATVGGVDWMIEKPEGGGTKVTSTYRMTYVEVILDERFTDVAPLMELAPAVKKAVPPSL